MKDQLEDIKTQVAAQPDPVASANEDEIRMEQTKRIKPDRTGEYLGALALAGCGATDLSSLLKWASRVRTLMPKQAAYNQSLAMIRRSSLVDFDSPMAWGQWCREVAQAAEQGDADHLHELEAAISQQNKVSA